MVFEWIDFEKSGNSYLSLNGYDVAEILKTDCVYFVYPFKNGNYFLIETKEYYDLETAKKAVEAQIYDFCVEFNTWYMR